MKKNKYKYFIYIYFMEENKNTIKHLVISGGGTYGLSAYGVLRELHKNGFWSLSNIQSCHGTSIGTAIIIIILCKYEWETIDDFIIKRPWNNVFKFDINKCLDAFDKCGLYDKTVMIDAFKPILLGADIDLTITMKEFYEKTKVEFYIYTVELNSFELECISYKTHPDMQVIDACYMSCSLPLIFKPLTIENKTYVDGGIFLNYPILECLNTMDAEPNEILGIRKKIIDVIPTPEFVQSFNLFEYIMHLFRNMMAKVNNENNKNKNKDATKEFVNEININMECMNIDSITKFVVSEQYRKELIEIGVKEATSFLANKDK